MFNIYVNFSESKSYYIIKLGCFIYNYKVLLSTCSLGLHDLHCAQHITSHGFNMVTPAMLVALLFTHAYWEVQTSIMDIHKL